MDTIKINKQNTKMVAHAGLFGLETANTCAGFIAAGNRSYWGVECDVRVAKDGLVVIHNDSTEGFAPETVIMSESTVEHIQKVALYKRHFFHSMEDYGITPRINPPRSDLRIPTLQEYISICKHYDKVCVTELKHAMTPETIADVVAAFREQDYLENMVFTSFFWENLVQIRKLLPDCPVQFLTDEKYDFTDEFLDKVAQNGFDLDIHIFTTTRELVERIHARGIALNVWTCDWVDKAENLVAWGVDYITSNILE
jgi:glycerophosphoryl diester phosphodiesterase